MRVLVTGSAGYIGRRLVPRVGALGHRVWTPLAFVPDWRWLFDRDDCPWYPSMRLFRQKTAGDWPSVIKRLSAAIVKQAAHKPAPEA